MARNGADEFAIAQTKSQRGPWENDSGNEFWVVGQFESHGELTILTVAQS
jgi:hypothetical protein